VADPHAATNVNPTSTATNLRSNVRVVVVAKAVPSLVVESAVRPVPREGGDTDAMVRTGASSAKPTLAVTRGTPESTVVSDSHRRR